MARRSGVVLGVARTAMIIVLVGSGLWQKFRFHCTSQESEGTREVRSKEKLWLCYSLVKQGWSGRNK